MSDFYIEIQADGSLTNNKPLKAFCEAVGELPKGRYKLSITKYRKKRSNEQNAVLHWYLNEIAQETGMEMEVVKEVLKKKFLTTDVLDENGNVKCDKDGEVLQYVKNTRDLNTVEMMEFTENIRMWSQDFLNLYLPLPNEETELRFK